ncbi:hypothetical protein [Amorphus orientalis]|uniref:Uncharacterized protein n=1 Tax=Amorphus orientalis TaxID=649198 RepID=A0AAE4AUS5_9HYPH|nr:hypothetical protein [Amorphus orientalis]MDQ0317730.1 hypothetical protein [Amorphus orientalis]
MTVVHSFQLHTSFPQHGWEEMMTENLVKMSQTLNPRASSKTTALPAIGQEDEAYIIPDTNQLAFWTMDDWHIMPIPTGVLVFVEDEQAYFRWNPLVSDWTLAFPLNYSLPDIPKTLSFYAPGYIRPNATIFNYVTAEEFTLRAGAPGSHARLRVPPVGGSIVLTGNNGLTITFASGSTEGVFSQPEDAVYRFFEGPEGPFAQTDTFTLRSGETYDAMDLSVTLAGVARPPYES